MKSSRYPTSDEILHHTFCIALHCQELLKAGLNLEDLRLYIFHPTLGIVEKTVELLVEMSLQEDHQQTGLKEHQY
jgi:hypothetical protein